MNNIFSVFSTLLSLLLQSNVGAETFDTYSIVKKPQEIEVKGIYWTAYTASGERRRNELIEFIEKSELNAVVIDIKDSTGKVFLPNSISLVQEILSYDERASNLPDIVRELKEKGIYTIARLAVFQDPYLAEKKPQYALKNTSGNIWRDWKGLAWVDSSSEIVWKYNLDLAKEAVNAGFDEINFDYIRFPSDGPIDSIVYPFYHEGVDKNEIIAKFFKYIDKELKFYPTFTSVDLFGMTLWREDGVGIGQRYQDAVDYVDYISPMVYPSHYPSGFEGYSNPADFPYEIVYKSLDKGRDFIRNKRAKFRPWLQDFNLGAEYDSDKIINQMQATYDGGGFGWLFWNASNRYTEKAYYNE